MWSCWHSGSTRTRCIQSQYSAMRAVLITHNGQPSVLSNTTRLQYQKVYPPTITDFNEDRANRESPFSVLTYQF